jgi:hypothetical protein
MVQQEEQRMRAKTILIFAMSLTFRAAAQDTPKAQTQCDFPDGKTIRITYFSGQVGSTQLATDESLVTVKGISVPAGDYIVSPARDSHNNWTLTMRKKTGKGRSSQLPPVPMSATTPASPIENFKVSFDQTGASCTMHWGMEKSNILLSLEFTERNTDMPVLQ